MARHVKDSIMPSCHRQYAERRSSNQMGPAALSQLVNGAHAVLHRVGSPAILSCDCEHCRSLLPCCAPTFIIVNTPSTKQAYQVPMSAYTNLVRTKHRACIAITPSYIPDHERNRTERSEPPYSNRLYQSVRRRKAESENRNGRSVWAAPVPPIVSISVSPS